MKANKYVNGLLRTLALLDSDTEHYTTAAIMEALEIPNETFEDFDLEELVFHTALHFGDELVPSRNLYDCILKASEKLKINSVGSGTLIIDAPTPNDHYLKRMVDDLRLAQAAVFGE